MEFDNMKLIGDLFIENQVLTIQQRPYLSFDSNRRWLVAF